ncbi:MAG: hypothetical protein M1826_002635 [Phylliscum demangeonii]|nr:MAG: hypothetical protein M1826_002635 [Phylliscum demangeonii]
MSHTRQVQTDSISSSDAKASGSTQVKSRRPANTAFRQQRLKAWQPILTPKTVLPLFFVVGIIFAPIGGLLLWASSQVQEIVLDYSDCISQAPLGDGAAAFATMPPNKVHSSFKSSNASSVAPPMWKRNTTEVTYAPGVTLTTNVCSLLFDIPNNIGPPVLLYYRLTNFYQNHRRYVKSLDQDQLKGKYVSNATINKGSCKPLQLNDTDSKGFAYYPCGLIANSMFNDTFMSPQLVNVHKDSADNRTYAMTSRGIAWDSDKQLYGKTAYRWDQVAPPPNWRRRYPNGYTADNQPPDLRDDEPFQVWMRTAGLPTFSKLALRNDGEVMQSGTYRLDIRDNFPVTIYGGTKSLVISTRTVMGGKNPFLGIAYVVVGAICVLLGLLFTATHLIKPRKLGDHTYLSWNNDAPATTTATATATATGREMRPGGHADSA